MTNHKLIQGDCLNAMKDIPENSVDLIITDPPYGINFNSNWSVKKKYRKDVADTVNWDSEVIFPYEELLRVLKSTGQMYVFCNWKCFNKFPKPKNLIVWNKMHNGMGDLSSWGNSHEFILFYTKGFNSIKKRQPSVINFCNVNQNTHLKHPTQKPIEIMLPLIDASSKPGDVIFDPFAGSGTTLQACVNTKRNSINIEISEKYCDIIKERCFGQQSLFEKNTFEFEVI